MDETDINSVKSEKLKNLMEKSEKFRLLPVKEKQAMLLKIINLSPEEQENKYLEFFTQENEEEKEKIQTREELFSKLMGKMQEMDRSIKILATKDKEQFAEKDETQKEQDLLKELNEM